MHAFRLPEKNRLILLLAAILGVGFLTTSLLSFVVSSNSVRRNIIDQQLPLSSDNVYSEIQRDLLAPVGISAQMAQDTFLRDWILDGEKDERPLVRFLAEIKTKFNANTAFLISERTHKYYHADGVLKTISQKDPQDTWYYNVRAMKERYTIDLDTDKANGNTLTVFINFRVFDYQNNFIGVTGVGITLKSIHALIQRYEERFKRNIFFVDSSGDIVLAGPSMRNQLGSIKNIEGISQIAKQILSGSEQAKQLSYSKRNATILVNTRFIPELKWYLVVEENESAAVRPMRNMLGLNLVVSTLATLLVLGVTLYFVNRYQRQLEHAAATDKLSGLNNREMGQILLDQALRNAPRDKEPVSLIVVDIDHFKRINDQHGHLAGDRVIQSVSALLRSDVRKSDVVARWGGEEFLVLLPACTLDQAFKWSEKMRATIAAHVFDNAHPGLHVTVSMGIAQYTPDETRETLFARADAALYEAKRSGRDRVVSAPLAQT